MKTLTLGANRPLKIELPDAFFNVLYTMASLEGRDIEGKGAEEMAAFFIMRGIIEDVHAEQHEGGYWGYLTCKGWLQDIKDEPFYKELMEPSGERA